MQTTTNPTSAPEAAGEGILESDRAGLLPIPTGFKVLCAVPKAKETHGDTGIAKTSQAMYEEETGTTVLFVLALGPDAYADKARFPSGPWCKKGDFVLIRTYSGTRFTVFGTELRVINDDMVEAIVKDPRGVLRFGA